MAAAYMTVMLTGFFVGRSRVHMASFIALFASIALLNTDAADFESVYQPIYRNPDLYRGVIEPGWLYLCIAGRSIGMSYSLFAAVLSGLSSALLLFVVWRTTDNPSFFASLYLMYPGLISLVQLRQFVASSVVVLAIYVLSRNGRKSLVLFVLIVLVAVSLHRTALILAILPVIQIYITAERMERTLLGVMAIGAATVMVVDAQTVASHLFGESRTTLYLGVSTYTSEGSGILGGASNAILIMLVWMLVSSGCSVGSTSDKSDSVDQFRRYVHFSNVITMTLIPFVFVSTDFMRFERYAFILSMIDSSRRVSPAWRERSVMVMFASIAIAILFAYFLILWNNYNTVVVPLLTFEYWPSLFL